MRYLGFVLHAYQPPTQPQTMIDKIRRESYERVIKAVEDNKHIFLSLDIAKSLGERLPRELLERIQCLYRNRRIELINTAAYHFLLPLVPKHIAARQLLLNLEFYREDIIGGNLAPSGVWLPELAFTPWLAGVVKDLGFSWIIADDEPFIYTQSQHPPEKRAPQTWIPMINNCGIFLQSHLWSEKIWRGEYERGDSFAQTLLLELDAWQKACYIAGSDTYLILALDFETFGHHHPQHITDTLEIFFVPFFEELRRHRDEVEISSLEYLFTGLEKRDILPSEIKPGSWVTKKEHIDRGTPFPLWNHPDNPFHRSWNEFMALTFASAPRHPQPELQELLDKAFYSCSPWWACMKKEEGRDIAGWCLPMFREIVNLLPQPKKIARLVELIREMEHFVST